MIIGSWFDLWFSDASIISSVIYHDTLRCVRGLNRLNKIYSVQFTDHLARQLLSRASCRQFNISPSIHGTKLSRGLAVKFLSQ